MALPVINTAKYEVVIPSSGEKVTYRPYLVKEEKILMVAMESNDSKQIVRSIKDVLKNCIENINVDDLTLFDLEYLFMILRGKSVGENIEINAKCEKCNELTPYSLSLDSINPPKIREEENHTVMLTDEVGVKLKYPSVDDMAEIGGITNDLNPESTFNIVSMIIESVFTNDDVFSMSEQSDEERKRFIDGLSTSQFSTLLEFFEDLPSMTAKLKFDCIHCKHHNDVELKGLQSFFI